jgi:hypothetical protein
MIDINDALDYVIRREPAFTGAPAEVLAAHDCGETMEIVTRFASWSLWVEGGQLYGEC